MEVALTVKSGDSISLSTDHEQADLVISVSEDSSMDAGKISLTSIEAIILRAALNAIYQDYT